MQWGRCTPRPMTNGDDEQVQPTKSGYSDDRGRRALCRRIGDDRFAGYQQGKERPGQDASARSRGYRKSSLLAEFGSAQSRCGRRHAYRPALFQPERRLSQSVPGRCARWRCTPRIHISSTPSPAWCCSSAVRICSSRSASTSRAGGCRSCRPARATSASSAARAGSSTARSTRRCSTSRAARWTAAWETSTRAAIRAAFVRKYAGEEGAGAGWDVLQRHGSRIELPDPFLHDFAV